MIEFVEREETYATKTHSGVEAYRLVNGKIVNLSDWNGEKWGRCWYDGQEDEPSFIARPVYRWEIENTGVSTLDEGSDEWERAVEIVGIEESF